MRTQGSSYHSVTFDTDLLAICVALTENEKIDLEAKTGGRIVLEARHVIDRGGALRVVGKAVNPPFAKLFLMNVVPRSSPTSQLRNQRCTAE